VKVKFFGCDAEAAPDNTSFCIQNFFLVFSFHERNKNKKKRRRKKVKWKREKEEERK